MKEVQQALQIITQGLNIAVSAGAFKKTEDVAILHSSTSCLTNFFIQLEKDSKEDIKQKELGKELKEVPVKSPKAKN